MSKRLGQTPFRDLLSPSLAKDAGMVAVADALDSALDTSTRAIPNALLYARLAKDSGFVEPVPMAAPLVRLAEQGGGLRELPEPLLDLLAWQLHVDGYDEALSVQAKRELIQCSLLLHRRKGTPWAVRTAVEKALQSAAQIHQWFEYGGEPYFFRVLSDVTGKPITEAAMRAALRLIHEYKNTRSWLDYLATSSRQEAPVHVGFAVKGRTRMSILMRFFAPPIAPTPVYLGGVSGGRSRAWISPVPPVPTAEQINESIKPAPVHYAGVGGGHSRAWISPVAPAPSGPQVVQQFTALGQKNLTRSKICPM